MSAYDSDPDHFVRWLANGPCHASERSLRQSFSSRGTYGRYLRTTLEAACLAVTSGAHLVEVEAEVSDLAVGETSIDVAATDGRRFAVDCVALCVGNLPQALPVEAGPVPDRLDRYVSVPWTPGALEGVGPQDTVGLIGTGLTMVDVVLDLRSRGHRGRLVALSRRGLLPVPHRDVAPYPPFLAADRPPGRLSALLAVVRREVALAARRGVDWRGVVDALRAQSDTLWRTLPLAERRRFLRHARPYWEIHRHRVAPEVADELDALRRSGTLSVIAGKIVSLTAGAGAISLQVRHRADGRTRPLDVDWLVNCSGPQLDYELIRDRLVRSLFAAGLARPDALKLGLEVSDDFRLVGRDGTPAPSLYALGPTIRGALWETTAVPDIRKQCEALARHISQRHCARQATHGPSLQ
jgi:uncharacterized NAD(P)/FAD-binding protein YdhS